MKSLLTVVGLFLFLCCGRGSAADLSFVVIQPGQPGSPEEAQPVMNVLADYLRERVKADKIQGKYENRLPEALELLRREKPRWGIVSLPFYVRHAEGLRLVPVASTRPNGRSKDVWTLMAPRDTAGDWRTLRGTVLGTMLFEPGSAACLLFRVAHRQLPMHFEGTSRPLLAIRRMVNVRPAGKDISAVVLDSSQVEALKTLPLAEKLQGIHQSGELPTSPVVSFGPPDEGTRSLVSALMAMKDDEKGRELLQVLQTDGFGAPDDTLDGLRLKTEDPNGRCPP